MIYTLDTNVITAMIERNPFTLERWREAILSKTPVTMNAISYYEIRRGLNLPTFQRKFQIFQQLIEQQSVLQLDMKSLDLAAEIYQNLRIAGTPLEDADVLIAATAIRYDAVLVTDNTKHFARVPHLTLENWIERS